MPRAKIIIPHSELQRLYVDEKWTPAKIGQKFNCDAITVRSRIKEAGIKLKTKSEAQTHYPRHPFSGTDIEKAYMLGFRYGDLNVYMPKGASSTIVVRSHTTKEAQNQVFRDLFSKYGTIASSNSLRTTQMNCYLDTSFSFLLDKYPIDMRRWLLKTNDRFSAFIAGYVDAEGTFGLNQGRGRFKIDAYDVEILRDIYEFLVKQTPKVKFRIIAHEGVNDYGWVWKRDLWRLEINEANALEKLIINLAPYLRHEKRVNDANMVLQNIQQRRQHGTIK